MKDVFLKISRLMIGLFLYSFGIVISINAQEGLAPWHVFHQGLSFQMNITLGNAIQIVGITILY